MTSTRPIVIIEDSDEDYEVTSQLLRDAGAANPLIRCRNGKEVNAFLNSEAFAGELSSPPPCLILLDLNLPGADGRELLLEIREQSRLQTVPVVILTTSSNQMDVRLCYRRGAHGYVLKPVDLERFERTIKAVADYWLRAVEPAEPEGDVLWPLNA